MGSAEDPDRFKNLYGQAQNWTLANDTSLFQCLEDFSRRIVARTESTEQRLRDAVQECQTSRVRLQTCLNAFNMLSNTQFMESRVRDEENQPVKKPEEKSVADTAKEQETPENRRLTELREAVSLTKNVLNSYFDSVEVNIDDSDEEETSTSKRSFREPKDPYLRRALPYLIGSAEFNRDRYIGLKLQVEEQEIVPDEDIVLTAKLDDVLVPAQSVIDAERAASRSFNNSGRDTPQSSEDVRNADYVPTKLPTIPRRDTTLVSSSESENEDDIFAARPIGPAKTSPARPGPPSRPPENDTPSFTPRSSSQSSIHSVAPSKPVTSLFDAEDEDDLFSVPNPSVKSRGEKSSDIPTPKPTAAARPPKSATLFEDDRTEENDSVFATPKPSETANPFLSELSKKIGIPAPVQGGKPLASKIVEPAESEPLPPTVVPTRTVKPTKKPSLFDDDDGDDDLFAIAPKPTNRTVQKPIAEEKEIVASKPNLPAVVPESALETAKKSVSTKKGKPSIFDDEEEDDDLGVFTPAKKNTEKQKLEEKSSARTAKDAQKVQGVFESSEDDDLFATNKKWKLPGLDNGPLTPSSKEEPVLPAPPSKTPAPATQPPPVKPSAIKGSNIFDEDSESEDLFAVAAKSKPIVQTPPSEKKVESVVEQPSKELQPMPEPAEKITSPRRKGVEKWQLPGLGLPTESKPKQEDIKPVDYLADPRKFASSDDQFIDIPATKTHSVISETAEPVGSDSGTVINNPLDKQSAADGASATKTLEEIKAKPSGLKSKSLFDEGEEEDDLFAKKVEAPPKKADTSVKKWKLPDLAPQNVESSPVVAPAEPVDTEHMTPRTAASPRGFERQLGNQQNTDDAVVTPAVIEKVDNLNKLKSTSRSLDADIDDTDFVEPKLEPAPKTAPAKLYQPMKWKLPGLTSSPVLPSVEETNDMPSDTASVTEIVQSPPATPKPVPRRRGIKTSGEAGQDEEKHRSATPPGVADNAVKVKTEEHNVSDRKEGTTIPMIPEMTIDTMAEVKSSEPPKPPVAARRSAKTASPPTTVISERGEERKVNEEGRTTDKPVESSAKAVEHPLPVDVKTEMKLPELDEILPPLPKLPSLIKAELPVLPKESDIDPLQSVAAPVQEPAIQKPSPPKSSPAVLSFAMPERDSQLFATPEPPPLSTSSSFSGSLTSLKERGGSLFLDEDSEEDLFGKSNPVKQMPVAKVSSAKSEKTGVSVNLLNPLGSGEGDVSSVPRPAKKTVFDKETKKKPALFDSDEEDLFESTASAAKAVQQTLASQTAGVGMGNKGDVKKSTKPSLFDDDDDDLFKN
ncbi:WASH complex subunit 2-like [Paramacrobiotus metropolitanus]|uniref:WASH complex subunit 2-like n=1 Tax=Paramacrobiotus metropolitanus TaxID=2943436 RepID=UPI00244573E0|nr:WASH complex subunit 2-like [Paramacrobiotus metropolitanus]